MGKAIVPRIKSHRPSAAMVVSLIALFVALGGTSYAALKLPKNSVGSAQVINGSLQKADLSKKTVAAVKGNAGRAGAQGPAGGDLAGTYPDPTLKNGAVTTAKFAAGALAPNADLLDGLNSIAFLPVGGKAADSDKLDGLDSTSLILGRNGQEYRFATVFTTGGLERFETPFGTEEVSCGGTARYFFRRFANSPGGQTIRVFDQNNGGAPDYYTNDIGFNGRIHDTTGVEHDTLEMADASGNTLEVDVWARFISALNCEFIVRFSYGAGPS